MSTPEEIINMFWFCLKSSENYVILQEFEKQKDMESRLRFIHKFNKIYGHFKIY